MYHIEHTPTREYKSPNSIMTGKDISVANIKNIRNINTDDCICETEDEEWDWDWDEAALPIISGKLHF